MKTLMICGKLGKVFSLNVSISTPRYVPSAFVRWNQLGSHLIWKKWEWMPVTCLSSKAVRSEILMTGWNSRNVAFQDNERDPHKTWQISNELTSRKTHSFWVKEIKLDNNSIRDPCEMSSVFNNYFSSIGPTLIDNIHHPTNGPLHFDYIMETEHRFNLKTTEPSKVFTLLVSLA